MIRSKANPKCYLYRAARRDSGASFHYAANERHANCAAHEHGIVEGLVLAADGGQKKHQNQGQRRGKQIMESERWAQKYWQHIKRRLYKEGQ